VIPPPPPIPFPRWAEAEESAAIPRAGVGKTFIKHGLSPLPVSEIDVDSVKWLSFTGCQEGSKIQEKMMRAVGSSHFGMAMNLPFKDGTQIVAGTSFTYHEIEKASKGEVPTLRNTNALYTIKAVIFPLDEKALSRAAARAPVSDEGRPSPLPTHAIDVNNVALLAIRSQNTKDGKAGKVKVQSHCYLIAISNPCL